MNVDDSEIVKFRNMSDSWWDPNGKFKPLHDLNELRISYIKEYLMLEGIKLTDANVLDVGCGGGLLSEPISRLGANVVGIDVVEDNICIAKEHALKSGLNIDYRFCSTEDLTSEDGKFDIIFAMEVIEHVKDIELFVKDCISLLSEGGMFFLSSINRTYKSLGLAIVMAEYILKWLPKGTHEWKKFVTPGEVYALLKACGVSVVNCQGMNFNILSRKWILGDKFDVNYIMCGKKH